MTTVSFSNTAARASRNDQPFTVIWQGNKDEDTGHFVDGVPIEEAFNHITVVIPSHYGHLDVDTISRKEWGYMACGEQHDGDNPYDSIDVLYVLEGNLAALDIPDEAETD